MGNYRVLQNIVIGLLGVMFLVSLFFGYRAGRDYSRAKVTVYNAQEIVKGLNYFKADQARYPSPDEFGDRNIALEYFSVFPFPEPKSSYCKARYEYKTAKSQEFKLNYCLETSVGNASTGWNTFDELTKF